MNPVSSSEDIKPPLGLNGVLKVPAHPSGTMASFTKHICAICGDRSSVDANPSMCTMSKGKVTSVDEHTSRGWIWRFCTSALRPGQVKLICDPRDETSWFLNKARSPRSGLDTWGSVSCCTTAWGCADGLEKLEMKNDSNRP
ncbi:retinoic acid receptor rxr- hypothetical protein [Limosa lapponica baueri]|uniref:Nuclear/hormone receptor activator site AF-1 domain-containing protein n=1 Tax=Limosa lapponica baueri TaxID=1758121 RepID=A0A2I0T996_LIMLA|nr:retinoic acid receptor rxr- hypothetical protein [Limosa lapponica baueri]